MMLKDKLKQRLGAAHGAQTLGQLLPNANSADAKREIDAAKDAGKATLSFRDIGDATPQAMRRAA